MFNGKIDQLAFIVRSDEEEQAVKERFGLQDAEWIEDHVVAKGIVRGVKKSNTAKLLFNYDLGIELEILRYTEGENYATFVPPGHLCHVGIHAGADEPVPTFDAPIIQQVETQSHTNEFLLSTGRRYRYTIYDTRSTMGVYMKVIERIEREEEKGDGDAE